MSRSQGIGLSVVFAFIGIVVAWSVVKSQSPPGSRIALQPPPARPVFGTPLTPKNPPESSSGAASGENAESGTTATRVPASVAPLPSPPAEIVVQVAGAVHKPGVYHLKEGARNDDALKAAGGPTAEANTASINLAARAQDGSQIYVKTTREQPTGGASDEPITVSSSNSPSKKADTAHFHAATAAGKKTNTGSKSAKLTDPSKGKINLNTANAEELQRIPGIGPSMAERLIAYREENHGFQSVEDLMQVSGIGEKKFGKMAPFVKVH